MENHIQVVLKVTSTSAEMIILAALSEAFLQLTSVLMNVREIKNGTFLRMTKSVRNVG